jgi:hypothetical protein
MKSWDCVHLPPPSTPHLISHQSQVQHAFFYTVTRRREPSVIAAEVQLQWAPGCQVLVKLPSLPEQEWTRAIVRGSYQEGAYAALLYSVELVEPAKRLLHGIRKEYMSYRLLSPDPPFAHGKNDSDQTDGQRLSPTNAETDEAISRSSPEPPPDVNALSASDEASTSCVQSALPPELPGVANEVVPSWTALSLRASGRYRWNILTPNQKLLMTSPWGTATLSSRSRRGWLSMVRT